MNSSHPGSDSVDTVENVVGVEGRQALGPETWDSLPECSHLDKRLLQQQNTKKLKITAGMRSWGNYKQ